MINGQQEIAELICSVDNLDGVWKAAARPSIFSMLHNFRSLCYLSQTPVGEDNSSKCSSKQFLGGKWLLYRDYGLELYLQVQEKLKRKVCFKNIVESPIKEMLSFDWQRKAFKSRELAGMLVKPPPQKKKEEAKKREHWTTPATSGMQFLWWVPQYMDW